jgi:drug/metabolite transporter (DMT)-like permease
MSEKSGQWRMIVAMILSGTIGLMVLTSGQSPLTAVFFRCLIGGVALLGWLAWQGGWKALDRRALFWIVLGAGALVLNWLCLFWSFTLSGISIATVVYHVQPFFLILLVAVGQRELPSWRKIPLLVLAFIGVALIANIDFSTPQQGLFDGILLALAAAFLYAIATLATRQLSQFAPAQIAGLQLTLGALVLAPITNFSIASFSWQAWACLMTLGLVHTGLMYNLMYAAFQRLRTEMIATLSFIYPLVAIIVDTLFFDLSLNVAQMIGMLMILAAVVVNQYAPSPKKNLRVQTAAAAHES